VTVTPAHDHPTADAELQVHYLPTVDETQVIAAVRCIRGPVRVGARFRHIRDTTVPIDLELTRIRMYKSDLEELDPGLTALVALRGAGTLLLTPGNPTSGYQIIQGTNPRS
jgi:hypothetical protein